MRLDELLQNKGETLFSIDADASLETAARALTEKRIGAMAILDQHGRIQGILSERDISKAVGARGAAVSDGLVSDIMTKDVITCHQDNEITDLFHIMVDNNIRHLPVIDGDRAVAMLSIRDISRALIDLYEADNRDLKNLICSLEVNAA